MERSHHLLPRLCLQEFDSGRIAPRVGYAVLASNQSISEFEARKLVARAAEEGFDMFWVRAYSSLETEAFDYRGTLLELSADRETALARAQRARKRFAIREVEDDKDWGYVERLLAFSGRTRFLDDPNVSEATARRHKMSMLRTHLQDRDGIVALAFSTGPQPQSVGYLCTSLDQNAVRMYEMAVDPRFRTGLGAGFAALNLIAHNLRRFAADFPDIHQVDTSIYQHNPASLSLFRKLGFILTGQANHYYHCWLGRTPPQKP